MAVLATAGHVDHGKSSLVAALTGMEPDRLEEERRRGLTIDLGFAWFTLPSGREVGFVDVPGHERFVRTMLAGVGPVRLVMFVVAADEGWSAQSEEHLAILDLLGVDGAVIALTKRDLVDEARLGVAGNDVRARVAGTVLADAPIVACSARTGEGLEELRHALDAMCSAAPPPRDEARARLSVDRVFTMKGSGTVVTGTLDGGTLSVGEEVTVLPGGDDVRIRGLQTHRRSVERAEPGSRVAVNLASTPRGDLTRGDALVTSGTRGETTVLEVELRPARGVEAPPARGAFTFHIGSAERNARIRTYARDEADDATTYARVTLDSPVVAEAGDRFVLREAGRKATVAGGEVLDAHPPARPGASPPRRLARRRGLRGAALAAAAVTERGAIRDGPLREIAGATPDADADGDGEVRRSGGWWLSDALVGSISASIVAMLERHHRERPLEQGAPIALARESVGASLRRSRIAPEPDLIEVLLTRLSDDAVVVRDAAFLRLPSHRPAGEDDPTLRRLLARVEGPTPPTIPELLAEGVPRAAIDAAVRAGTIVRIAPTLVISAGLLEAAIAAVKESGDDGITVSALRERLGTSRKYAVPLAEHLDATKVTRREGDLRFAR